MFSSDWEQTGILAVSGEWTNQLRVGSTRGTGRGSIAMLMPHTAFRSGSIVAVLSKVGPAPHFTRELSVYLRRYFVLATDQFTQC